jgi:hypothetical protein
MEVYEKKEATRNPEIPGVTNNVTEPDVGKCLKDLIAEVTDFKRQLISARNKDHTKLTKIVTDLEENSRELEVQRLSIERIDNKLARISDFQEAFTSGKIGLFAKADTTTKSHARKSIN